MKKILILGGGFAGLIAAEQLSEHFGGKHQITLVSPKRDFTFYPALLRVALGELDEKEVKFDLARKLHRLNVKFIEGEVLHLNPEFHRVQVTGTEFNGNISYDHLVIAMGRRLATERVPGFFEHAHHLLGVRAAKKFGKAIDEFVQGDIVIGLAQDSLLPVPVCETAFALSNKFFPDSPQKPITIKVVFPSTINEAFAGAEISEVLKAAFEKHQIELVENFQVDEISGDKILAKDGTEMAYDLCMLLPPFVGQARLSENRITDEFNFVKVDEFMRVEGLENAYAVGDIVSYPGPKLAHIAVGQARIAAQNLIREIEGEEPEALYFHEIASIIDHAGPESIYLHYGVWDESMYRLKSGKIWSMVKRIHDKVWRSRHENVWFEKGV